MGWIRSIAVAFVFATCWAACSDDGGGAGGSSSVDRYAGSDCYACVTQSCGMERDACNADPGCAGYLACIEDCPTVASGDVDSACVLACPPIDSSAGQQAKSTFDACRAQGPGSSCSACGTTGMGGAGGAASTCEYTEANLCNECAPSESTDVCLKCDNENCCDVSADIEAGGPGADVWLCWVMCPDYACDKACFETYPDQVSYLGAWRSCIDVKCKTQGACTSGLGPCNECLISMCADPYARCFANGDCWQLYQCVGNCPDVTCGDQCVADFPDGATDYEAFGACTGLSCVDACGGA